MNFIQNLLVLTSLTCSIASANSTISLEYEGTADLSVESINSLKDVEKYDDAYLSAPNSYNPITKAFSIARCMSEGSCDDVYATSLIDFNIRLHNNYSKEQAEMMLSTYVTGLIAGAQTEDFRESIYNEAGFALTFKQKILVAKNLGQIMVKNYEVERTGDGERSEGIVTVDEIYNALQTVGSSERTYAGVCRDIAVAQAVALRKMGVKHVYIINHAVINGGHASLLTQDENDPSKVIHIDYGETKPNLTNGLSGLTKQGTLATTGINFRVFDSQGQPIDRVPTEIGYVLYKMSGLDTDRVAPGISAEGISILNLKYESNIAKVNAFVSNTELGEKTVGLGLNVKIIDFKSEHGIEATTDIASAIHMSKVDKSYFESESMGIFGAINTQIKSPSFSYRNLYSLRARSTATFGLYYGKSSTKALRSARSDNNSTFYEREGEVIDPMNIISFGITAKQKYGKYSIATDIDAYGSITKADTRDEGSDSLQYLHTLISNTISRELNHRYEVALSNKLYLRKTGTSMTNSIIVRSQDNTEVYEVGFSSPIKGEVPFWVEGSSKEAFIGINKSFLKNRAKLKVKYIRKIDFDENELNLNLNVKFKN